MNKKIYEAPASKTWVINNKNIIAASRAYNEVGDSGVDYVKGHRYVDVWDDEEGY